MDQATTAVGGGNLPPAAGGMVDDNMQTVNNQPVQSISPSPATDQPVETRKPFLLTRHQLIFIGLLGGLVLVFTFVLGVWAGEKRALRKQPLPQVQPTPTTIQPSPTTVPTPTPTFIPTPTPSSNSSSGGRTGKIKTPESGTPCVEGKECQICFPTDIWGWNIACYPGICVRGKCVDISPTEQPEKKLIR